MNRRVVITGMGVVSPNGVGLSAFEEAIRKGESGLRTHEDLQALNFRCHVAGKPELTDAVKTSYFSKLDLKGLKSSGIEYGVVAGMEAWGDAGLPILEEEDPKSGIIFGTGILGVEKLHEAFGLIDQGRVHRLGSTSVLQTMASGISAFLGGKLGCGNQVTTNSSACTTGTESILMGYDRIRYGLAQRMLVGSCGESGPYVWGGFDALRILPYSYNENPQGASRPMSASAQGMVPGSGAGAMVLEDLEQAQKRGATIYGEVIGGYVNSGGQRQGGSMTAPNPKAVVRCIEGAIAAAGVKADQIDGINGHLTATRMDVEEIKNWMRALGRREGDFPFINSLKGMTGHCLSAAGSIESIATVLQLYKGFVFGNRNCEDLHPEIERLISRDRVPTTSLHYQPEVVLKASFGFGDVNSVLAFKKCD